MEWLDRSLGDLYRILVALEHGGGDPLIQGLIDREPLPTDFVHARITLRSLLQLLEQTGGSTWLPEEVVSFLRTLKADPGRALPLSPVEEYRERIHTALYEITVDYRKTFVDMLTAGGYDFVQPDVKSAIGNFVFPAPTNAFTREVSLTTVLVHYDHPVMSTQEILADFTRRGLRPATIAELLAFGAAHPKKQREFPIVGLGTVWTLTGNDQSAAYLTGSNDERKVGRCQPDLSWSESCRFLAVIQDIQKQ